MSSPAMIRDAQLPAGGHHPSRRSWDSIRKRMVAPGVSHAVMIIAVLLTMFPMLYAVLLATQVPAQFYDFPPRFLPGSSLVDNSRYVWDTINMDRLLLNTTIISVGVAVGKIVLSILAGFAFVYFQFPGRGAVFILILLTHMLPVPVRIVPTFELLDQMGWVDTYAGLTIPFLASATGTLLFRQLYQTIPPSLADAARIDGAGPLHFLLSIVIPLSRTNIAALFLVEFIYMWNQYLWPLIIANSDATRVVQIGLKALVATDAAVEWHYVMAGTVISVIPPLVVLVLLQHSLLEGMSLYEDKS
jgi:sn-glycerol 3-phosphate transport system permease protein